MSRRTLEIAAICGGIAPFLTYACILLAIGSYRPFSWTNNALSDLGIVSGITMILFDGGLIVGGILFAFFAIGLFSFLGKSLVGRVGCVFFFLAWISLICVGIFNEHFVPTHYIFSVSLFTFMSLALLVFTGAFWLKGQKRMSIFTLILGLIASTLWVLQLTVHYVPNVAIPEFVSGLAAVIWVLVVSYKMFKQQSHTT
jgi:hypothetical membrane protein